MADPFVAEIRMFGFNFAPVGWAKCEGQLLPISQNTALFSLLGTYYGGDGRSSFGLPNLASNLAIGTGWGPGLSERSLGESGGQASVALTSAQVPPHTHGLSGTASATASSPAGALLAPTATGVPAYRAPGALTTMAGSSLTAAGQSAPHENRPPSLTVTYCIALQGVYPPRP
jgi:microcystin-dependent protein